MLPSLGLLHLVRLWPRNVLPRGEPRSTNTLGTFKGLQGLREAGSCKLSNVLAGGFSVRSGAVLCSVEGVHYELFGLESDEALEGHRHTSQLQSSGWPSARTVRRAHLRDIPSLTRQRIRSACSGVPASFVKSPYLLAVSALLADAASLCGFSLPLGMPLAPSLPLDLPSPR